MDVADNMRRNVLTLLTLQSKLQEEGPSFHCPACRDAALPLPMTRGN